jgi:signal transduction histidine kinase
MWFSEIRPFLIQRLTSKLAKASGVQRFVEEQLTLFLDAVQISIETGEPAWLDPILEEWVRQHTEADGLSIAQDVHTLLNDITLETATLIHESYPENDINFTQTLLPILLYAQQKVFQSILARVNDEHQKKAVNIQNMLDRLEKSKSNFISIAGHELKTPLTLLEGYTTMFDEALRRDERIQDYRQYIVGIKKGASRLKQIVQDMIDVSLIDSRMLLLNFQPCSINNLIRVVVQDIKQGIPDRNLELRFQPIEETQEPIYLDEIRISQAIKNVIENAVKFTPDGGVITISGRRLPGFIEITVTDSGIGIDPEDQLIIFEKFSQLGNASLHSTSKSKFKGGGAGLGLPIAKGIVEAHGGTVWVESEGYNEVTYPGSIFHLMIPEYRNPPIINKSANKPNIGIEENN